MRGPRGASSLAHTDTYIVFCALDAPDPRDLADHEASHAVVHWWWVNRPGAVETSTSGDFYEVSIVRDPTAGREGHFDPGDGLWSASLSPRERGGVEHWALSVLAGPCSDERRAQYRPGTTDELWAGAFLAQFEEDSDTRHQWLASLKATAHRVLADADVRAMVDALAAALLERGGLSGEDAVAIMRETHRD